MWRRTILSFIPKHDRLHYWKSVQQAQQGHDFITYIKSAHPDYPMHQPIYVDFNDFLYRYQQFVGKETLGLDPKDGAMEFEEIRSHILTELESKIQGHQSEANNILSKHSWTRKLVSFK